MSFKKVGFNRIRK